MDSYISKKFVRFLVFIYSVFIFPLTSLSAFAVDGKKYEHQSQKKFLENKESSEDNLSDKENEKAGLIAQNIQTVSNVLSSSPSQLAEQAKSYALGKINSTVNGEAQKWLSQFGTAKINFSMDRKGKLDNGSLDLLLPLYDNKSDWLFFSQLGYRNKDSRHTLNLGFGGRYFTPSWMYGLNSFYDFDVTGNNKRIGLGGEAWTDYAKFSANTYWRVSDWHDSPHEKGWEERPANGFDIIGEFFLPAYPNIGGKLAYEQYFGDKVALFDRDTKQKDPSLARFGVNYTPVPLVTMGVDYKLGSGGHSETLFQTNFNYRFGVPFEAQLAPDSVASMRTLAGSRHDLVERNNQIVLDYRKKGEKEVLLNIQQQNITGYSYQRWDPIHATVTPKDAKLLWQINDSFSKNNGEITDGVNPIRLTLPKYDTDPKANNTYKLSFTAQDSNGNESKPSSITVTVEPFVLKGDVTKTQVKTNEPGEVAYKFLATITHGTKDNDALANLKVNNLQWSVDDVNSKEVKWTKGSDTTNGLGQLEATLSSTKPLKDVKVYLAMDGMRQKEIANNLDFSKEVESEYKVEVNTADSSPMEVGKGNGYTFTATIRDAANNLLKEKDVKVKWSVKNGLPHGVSWKKVKETDKTDANGQISATLVSEEAAQGIIVEVTIDGAKTASTADPVDFVKDKAKDITWNIPPEGKVYSAVYNQEQKIIVTIPNSSNVDFQQGHNHKFTNAEQYPGLKLDSGSPETVGLGKQITFTITSTQITEKEAIELTLTETGGNKVTIKSPPISFKAGLNDLKIFSFKVDNPGHQPNREYIANGQDKVRLKIEIRKGEDNSTARNISIDPSQIQWIANFDKSLKDKFNFTLESPTTNGVGLLYADLVTKAAIENGVRVSVKIPTSSSEGGKEVTLDDNQRINFEPVPKLAMFRVFNKDAPDIYQDFDINSNGPSNVFNSLQARLLKENGERLPDAGENFKVTYSGDVGTIVDSSKLINSESGLISFDMTPSTRGTRSALTEQTFKARIVNKSTREVTAYEYHWKPIRWFLMMGVNKEAKKQQKDAYCQSSNYLKDVKNIHVWNYDKRGDRDTLVNEFENLPKWGFFKVPVAGNTPSDKSIMNVLNIDTDKFEALNISTLQTQDTNDSTPVFCLFRD
ncbi:hypothetical protein Xvie_02741 [Xenorhabdus vietnamensis]|uniref:Inverse autotransporter beta-domain domain-containing protein n=1 Tax=Xenorhabdus vietnamensis TaxID=351656 RepID=A0A1Y2SB90_9GAMM|nr:inverse autotransporter beta domain-containing protein [Xenorhabdus vietnamensis]OTA15459.1 hypothetical protein Xvie_02741 [Xenorhabdus vietnamensis]